MGALHAIGSVNSGSVWPSYTLRFQRHLAGLPSLLRCTPLPSLFRSVELMVPIGSATRKDPMESAEKKPGGGIQQAQGNGAPNYDNDHGVERRVVRNFVHCARQSS